MNSVAINVEVLLKGLDKLQALQKALAKLAGVNTSGAGGAGANAGLGGGGRGQLDPAKFAQLLGQRLKTLNTQLQSTQQQINRTGQALAASGDRSQRSARQFEMLDTNLGRLKQRVAELTQQFARGNISQQQYVNGLAALTNRARSVGDSAGNMTARFNDAGNSLNRFTSYTGGLQDRLYSIQAGLTQLGAGLTAAFTAPLVGGAVASAKAAISFEDSFAGVSKTVDATDAELKQLAQEFRDLAKVIPISVNEINKIAESGGQLGVATKDLLSFTDTMGKLGATTNLSSEEAATALAQFATIIDNKAGPQFDRLGATVVDLGNKFAATEKGIVNIGQRIAGAGKQVGLNEAEILAIGTAVLSTGTKAEAGGTAIQQTLFGISRAVAQGGDDLKLFAKVAGVSADEFKQKFEQDAAGAFLLFIQGLNQFNAQGGNTIKIFDALGITGERQIRVLNNLSGNSDLLRRALEVSSNAWKENTALQTEFGIRAQTTTSQLQILYNRIYDIGITLGNLILPPLNQIVKFIAANLEPVFKRIYAFVQDLPAPLKIIIAAVATAAAAIGPLVLAATALLPIVIAVALIGGKLALIILGIVAALAVLVGVITGAVLAAVTAYQQNLFGLQETTAKVWATVVKFVKEAFAEIKAQVQRVMPQIQQAVRNGLETVQRFWNTYGDSIIKIVQYTWDTVTSYIKTAIRIIGSVITLILAFINGDYKTAWEAAGDIVFNAVQFIIKLARNLAEGVLELIKIGLKAIYNQIVNSIQDFISAGRNLGERTTDAIREAIKGGVPGIISALSEAAFEMSPGGVVYRLYTDAATRLGKATSKAFADNNNVADVAGGKMNFPDVAGATMGGAKYKDDSQPNIDFAGLNSLGGGGKGKKQRKQRPDLIDNAQKARLQAELNASQREIEDILRQNEARYEDNLVEFRRFVGTKEQLLVQQIKDEIEYQKKLLELNAARAAKSTEARDRDAAEAESIQIQDRIAALEAKQKEISATSARELIQYQKQIQAEYEATRIKLLEVTEQSQEAADAQVDLDFKERLIKLNAVVADSETFIAVARKQNNEEAAKSLQLDKDAAQAEIERINKIKTRLKLNNQVAALQKDIEEIESRRAVANATLEAEITQSGQNQIEADKRRAELAQQYDNELAEVLAKIQAIYDQTQSPAILKIIQQIQTQQIATKPGESFSDKQRQAGDATDLEFLRLDVEKARIQDQVNAGLLGEEAARRRILDVTKQHLAAILAALDAEIRLAQVAGDERRVLQLQREKEEIIAATEAERDYGDMIRKTAVQALSSGLNTFLTDVLNGTKSLKEAALDFARSFLQAIQQVIIKLIVVKLLSAAFGAAGGGSGSGFLGKFLGFARGGLVGSDGQPVKVQGFASGGLFSKGRSGVDTNIIAATVGEFIVNKDATKKNFALLEAINAGETFEGAFVDGGINGASVGADKSPLAQQQTAKAKQNIEVRNVNVLPNDLLDDYVTSADGTQTFLNMIGSNRQAVKSKLGL